MIVRIFHGFFTPVCLALLLTGLALTAFCEGTKQLMPYPSPYTAGLYIVSSTFGEYPNFAIDGCPANYRLNIQIKNAGEEILFGLRSPSSPPSIQFNLRKPDGTIALSGICPVSGAQTGFISTYNQAVTGPFPTLGGYNPLRYKVTSISDTGNYYFEIANPYVNTSYIFDYFDFQVVTGEHPTPVPSDMINGRVWSQSWQVYTALIPNYVFNGAFYIYSDDGIVTKLNFSNARIGAATIFCNPYGCFNTGNFLSDRKSVNQNTFLTFPAIADYRVFLNDPDSTLYPSGAFGQIIGFPGMIPDTAFPPCSGPQLIQVTVNKPGNIDLSLSFPYGFPFTTVNLFAPVVKGINEIPWNGLDGQGNPVPDGTSITITATFADGLTNLPIWDQETNPAGFIISLVRPVNPSGQVVETFWDDSQLTPAYMCPVAPQTTNLSGCLPGSIPGYPGCHPWGLNEEDCHDKMINTWWYGSSNTATATVIFPGIPGLPAGFGDSRCGPGTVMLHATPPPSCTIDWYDTIAGGTPLLSGDTTFITPVLSVTTTFYAESRNVITGCRSASRTPVVATILPAPSPTIMGPDTVCAGTSGHLYQTEMGKSHYKWWLSSGGVITSPNGTNAILVTWTEPGHHTVFVSYTDANGCPPSEPATFAVDVLSLPVATGPVSGPDHVCAGSLGLVYQVEPVFWVQSYNWSLPSGFILISGAGSHRIIVDLESTAVSGEITVNGVNNCGEGLPSPPFPVTVVQPPSAYAGPGDTICQGSPHTITGATASDYASVYWITDGDGALMDASSLSPTYIPASGETGLVTFILIVENPPCPADSSSTSLWIVSPASVDAGPDRGSCFPDPVSLEEASASGYQSLRWSTSGSGTFDDPSALHPTYNPAMEDFVAGSITLTLTVLATEPCEGLSDHLQLSLSHPPEIHAGPDASICEGMDFRVTGATAGHVSTLQWIHDGSGTLTGSGTLEPTYTPSPGETGIVTLTLTGTGEQECSGTTLTDQMILRIYTLSVDAGADQVVDSGTSAALAGWVGYGSGSYSVRWEPGGWVVDPATLETHTLPLSNDTLFILTVTDLVSWCVRWDSLMIRVRHTPSPGPDCLEIYNVITPNGDGINDTWIITCIEQVPENAVRILNRWGDLIRRFDRYDNTTQVWDGTNERGDPVPDGTYYFILTMKDRDTKTGWIFVRGGNK